MANTNLQFKTNFAVSSKIEPFYKGGKVQISKDEKHIFCTCGSRVNVLEISTGKIVHSVEHDDQEDITSFALSCDDELLVTASRALLLKQWDWKQAQCTRSWRAIHTVPVASMTFDSTSTLLATGGCDGTIKLWDVVKQYCTHNLKGSSGVVHLVQFHPDIGRLQLFSSSLDCGIRLWDLRSSQCVCVLQSHYSAVTSLCFSTDGHTMVSSGRDKICTVWDLKTKKAKRTVPVYEAVEGVVLLPENEDFSQIGVKSKDLHFITAGSKGVLRVWESSTARCVHTQTLSSTFNPVSGEEEEEEQQDDDPRSLTYLLHLPISSRLATVTAEHNILLYQLPALTTQQQFVGYNDEVLDVKFLGKGDSHIVVATNSCQLKVFELLTNSCQILYGHTDTVLSLDVFKKDSLFASCAKDRSVRVWQMDSDGGQVRCVAQGSSHTNAVGSIACSRLKSSFIVSGSQDCTVKVWDLPVDLPSTGADIHQLTASSTEKAHDKDINSVAVSPNDKLLASGSQDRTAKLWSLAEEGSVGLLGVFRGHRRGVWAVCFSPVDQVLATSSADGTAKLWSLQDFSCLKTFEGHDASVLKVIFVSRGTQLLTSGSDGLVKLWTIKTNECVKTLDAHQDKVWGLHASRKDDKVVTASADSNITVWVDVTEVELAEEQAKQEDHILKKQKLSNLLHEKKYLKALGLAISLDQPHTVLTVIKAIRQGEDRRELLENTLLKLRVDQKESLLRYCVVWNTNARNCQDAQAVLQVLLTHLPPEELLQYQGARTHLEGLIPYTERHMQRIGHLLQASMFLNYMWQKMRVTGAPSSMGQDEDMDTSALSQTQPFFMIDKEKGKGSGEETPDAGDDGGSGQDEHPNCPVEDEDDDEVSVTKKASANDGRMENGGVTGTNGNHHSESEESSDEEDMKEDENDHTKTVKCLPVSLPPQCQTLAS
ncbi:putative transducin beta-like protein 3 [Scophthalmus maximus]|uniref:Putative transducin beta-like protein 3 n=1 Tax=Scophthalmus maximus TaxID=52904 RepID=A0A2U9CQL9_SCOMX|nr:transducin beta-like protein 3 [Scophthalmus maximus]AWP18857.1 putative transducin beta-like protein 3 [Scophthalmus maximus]